MNAAEYLEDMRAGREIKKNNTVGLSGECSDEIFGGYPWFYRPEMLYSDFFPWIHAPKLRPSLFKGLNCDTGYDFIRQIYKDTLKACPVLPEDSDKMKLSRQASYLSVNYFMTSLLQRKDRMSMASGVEIRVPFADHRIFDFVYNVPWEIKFENGVEKSLLRNSMRGYLPDKILFRKKSPYPKTHNPHYRRAVSLLLQQVIDDPHSRVLEIVRKDALQALIDEEKSQPWYGQLMTTPQTIAYFLQLNYWLEKYNIEISE